MQLSLVHHQIASGDLKYDGPVKDHDRAMRYTTLLGVEWVGKVCSQEELFVELLAHTIGKSLGLPVLDFAYCRDEKIFMTLAQQFATSWLKERMIELTNLQEMGGVLLLDLLLHNHDRHIENVLLDMEELPRIWAIDFGKAKAQFVAEFGDDQDDIFEPNGVYLEIPQQILLPAARSRMAEFTSLTADFFRNVVELSVSSAGLNYSLETVVEVLHYRASKMEELLGVFEGRLR